METTTEEIGAKFINPQSSEAPKWLTRRLGRVDPDRVEGYAFGRAKDDIVVLFVFKEESMAFLTMDQEAARRLARNLYELATESE